MLRSLRVVTDSIPKVKLSLRRNGYISQRIFAEELGISQSTVSNFLTGKPVDFSYFTEICQKLALEWRDIADLETNYDAENEALDEENNFSPP
jgi:transcriptional regulator with XRE-family HTH domain